MRAVLGRRAAARRVLGARAAALGAPRPRHAPVLPSAAAEASGKPGPAGGGGSADAGDGGAGGADALACAAHLGRRSLSLRDGAVALRFEWSVAVDWAGDATSSVRASASFPSVCEFLFRSPLYYLSRVANE